MDMNVEVYVLIVNGFSVWWVRMVGVVYHCSEVFECSAYANRTDIFDGY